MNLDRQVTLSGPVSHGYCQTCFDAAMDEAEAYVVRTA